MWLWFFLFFILSRVAEQTIIKKKKNLSSSVLSSDPGLQAKVVGFRLPLDELEVKHGGSEALEVLQESKLTAGEGILISNCTFRVTAGVYPKNTQKIYACIYMISTSFEVQMLPSDAT